MNSFTPFEIQVIELLCSEVLSRVQLNAILSEAQLVSYEVTGAGYFLTVSHPLLPKERTVCSEPIVMGHVDGIDCGFVIFLERGEMMLECHSWGSVDLPEDLRSRSLSVEVSKKEIRR